MLGRFEYFEIRPRTVGVMVHQNSLDEVHRIGIERIRRTYGGGPRTNREAEASLSCWAALETVLVECRATFVILDLSRPRFLACVGEVHPVRLYIGSDEDAVILSDSLPEVIAAATSLALEPLAVWQSMYRGFVPSPNTVYDGIFKLPVRMPFEFTVSGNVGRRLEECLCRAFLRFLDQKFDRFVAACERWSDISIEDARSALFDGATSAIRSTVGESARPSIFLSGGADSLTVLELLLRCGVDRQRIFAMHFDLSGDGSGRDVRATRGVSSKYGIELGLLSADRDELLGSAERAVASMREPVGDFGYIPAFLLFERFSERIGVALTGDGADVFVHYIRSIRAIESISASTAFRLRERLRRFGPIDSRLARLEQEKYFNAGKPLWTILFNPVQRYHGIYFGSQVPPAADRRIVDQGELLPLARWLLGKDLAGLRLAMPIYCFFVEFPDFYARKIHELALDRNKGVFNLMCDERLFMAVSPMFSAFAQGGRPIGVENKRVQRDLIASYGDSSYILDRKVALTTSPEHVQNLTAALAPASDVSRMLARFRVLAESRDGASTGFNALSSKQRFAAAVIAFWTQTHRGRALDWTG